MTQEGANIRKGDYDQSVPQKERILKTRVFGCESLICKEGEKMTGMNIQNKGH